MIYFVVSLEALLLPKGSVELPIVISASKINRIRQSDRIRSGHTDATIRRATSLDSS